MLPELSIVIPAYKQQSTIKEDLLHIYEVMKQTRFTFEIIVVVDGFLDKTLEEAQKIIRPEISIVGYETNRGKGYALRYGMARCKGSYIAFIDSGMEIDPNGISMIMEHMIWYDADILVGSKRHPASKVNFPLIRRIYSWGYHTIVKILFGIPVSDTQVGLKVFRRKVLEQVLPRLMVKRFAIDIEILAVARFLGYKRIFEAPISMSMNLSGSGFQGFLFLDKNIRGMFLDTLSVFYRMYLLRFYDTKSKRRWTFDKELEMRVNTGELLK